MSTTHLSRCGNRRIWASTTCIGLRGEFDLGLIHGGHQGDQGMFAFPGHGAGILDHGFEEN